MPFKNPISLVSIIIPCYNQGQYLSAALESVLAQSYLHWECVVVNDASPDNTLEVANRYAEMDERIMVLNLEKNGGLANARNRGIAATRGNFIVPLDADDKLHPDFLEKTISVYAAHPGVKVIYSDAWQFGDSNSYAKRDDINMKELCIRNFFQPTALFSRHHFSLTEGYRRNIFGYEDWDMWLQLIDRIEHAKRIPEALVYLRVKSFSMIIELTDNKVMEQKVRQQLYLYNRRKIQKHFPSLALSFEKKLEQKDRVFMIGYKFKRIFLKLIGTAK
jgi:glycosyltransferase involved in cell wall biosynthesis